jgi:hypothetical protein
MPIPSRRSDRQVPRFPPARLNATVGIELSEPRDAAIRSHVIKVVVDLDRSDATRGDKDRAEAAVKRALAPYAPPAGERDQRKFRDVSEARKAADGGPVVVAVEGSVVCGDRPRGEDVEVARAVLAEAGYRVAVRERRECSERECWTESSIMWSRIEEIPSGWFTSSVCGKHNYRRCAKCTSVYVLTSMNAAGQAPALHCEVCGKVLVEWGASKIWSAELVTRGAVVV